MPRMQPPQGWLTGNEAAKRLHISGPLLSRYVSEGKIRRHVPHGRKYGFYNEEDVQVLENASIAFPGAKARLAHRSIFTIANRADVPAIAKIDHDAIHPSDDEYNNEYFLKWQQRNPETLFALRDTNGAVVGFLCILPLLRDVLDRFLRGEISPADFTNEDIPLFASGATIHLYIIALAIDPQYPLTLKHEYGRSLLAGFFSFLLALGERGVNVETITARSHTQDGIKLMRKLGLPWLVSPVPGMELFSVRVAESGMPFLRKYRAKLAEKQTLPD